MIASPEIRRMRSMAILCMLLGPLVSLMGLVAIATQRFMLWAAKRGIDTHADDLTRVAMDFSARTAGVMIPLGLVILIAGFRGVRDPRVGRRYLLGAAWFTTGTMVVLSVLWSYSLHGTSFDTFSGHLFGWASHLFNAVLTVLAARFLSSEPLRRACEGAPT